MDETITKKTIYLDARHRIAPPETAKWMVELIENDQGETTQEGWIDLELERAHPELKQ